MFRNIRARPIFPSPKEREVSKRLVVPRERHRAVIVTAPTEKHLAGVRHSTQGSPGTILTRQQAVGHNRKLRQVDDSRGDIAKQEESVAVVPSPRSNFAPCTFLHGRLHVPFSFDQRGVDSLHDPRRSFTFSTYQPFCFRKRIVDLVHMVELHDVHRHAGAHISQRRQRIFPVAQLAFTRTELLHHRVRREEVEIGLEHCVDHRVFHVFLFKKLDDFLELTGRRQLVYIEVGDAFKVNDVLVLDALRYKLGAIPTTVSGALKRKDVLLPLGVNELHPVVALAPQREVRVKLSLQHLDEDFVTSSQRANLVGDFLDKASELSPILFIDIPQGVIQFLHIGGKCIEIPFEGYPLLILLGVFTLHLPQFSLGSLKVKLVSRGVMDNPVKFFLNLERVLVEKFFSAIDELLDALPLPVNFGVAFRDASPQCQDRFTQFWANQRSHIC